MALLSVLLTVAVCLLLYRFDNKYTYPGDTGLNGITILEEEGLRDGCVVFLARGWEFYQYRLLAPADFAGGAPVPDAYVYIGQYGGFELDNRSADPHGTATYRLRISLPEAPRSYALALPEIYSACYVYVNGILLAERGVPQGQHPQAEVRPGMVTFHTGGQAEILIAVADASHYYSGLVYPPAFGLPEAVSALLGKRLLLRLLTCTLALLTAFPLLAAGAVRKQFLPVLQGAICLFFTGYTVYPVLHAVGWSGSLPWHRLEALCYNAFLFAAVLLQGKLLPVLPHFSRFVLASTGTMCLFALLGIGFSPSLGQMMLYSACLDAYKLCLAPYLLLLCCMGLRKGMSPPPLPLAGAASFAASLCMDRLLSPYEPVLTGWFPELGGVIIVFSFCVALCKSEWDMRREGSLSRERVLHADRQLALQRLRMDELRLYADETRRNRHDFRHHMALLQGLLDVNPAKARTYLSDLAAAYPVFGQPICRNLAADCLIRQYAEAARRSGIRVETAVDLPEKTAVSDLDLSIVVGNLLENALEALQKLPRSKERVLRITAGSSGSFLTMNVENSVDRPPRFLGGCLPSTKRVPSGIGLTSVRHVADRYGGSLWCQSTGGMFRISVVLKNEKVGNAI